MLLVISVIVSSFQMIRCTSFFFHQMKSCGGIAYRPTVFGNNHPLLLSPHPQSKQQTRAWQALCNAAAKQQNSEYIISDLPSFQTNQRSKIHDWQKPVEDTGGRRRRQKGGNRWDSAWISWNDVDSKGLWYWTPLRMGSKQFFILSWGFSPCYLHHMWCLEPMKYGTPGHKIISQKWSQPIICGQ